MPTWSTAVASEFLKLALRDGDQLDQSRVQNLIYIAHGIRLATSGHPLTGDRPEAWSFGPVYRRVADALRSAGNEPLFSIHFGPLNEVYASEHGRNILRPFDFRPWRDRPSGSDGGVIRQSPTHNAIACTRRRHGRVTSIEVWH